VKVALTLVFVAIAAAGFWFVDDTIAPLFLNSRIERLHERKLPRLFIEGGRTAYCRMKADDFRFPLPPGCRVEDGVVVGGFDTVDGSLEARFESTNHMTASEYKSYLSGRIQVGGEIHARTIPGGLLIKFHYFGDR
jgi:hypothetical protein